MFGNIYSHVLPKQKCIAEAHSLFGPDGNLNDSKQHQDVKALGKGLADFLKKHKA